MRHNQRKVTRALLRVIITCDAVARCSGQQIAAPVMYRWCCRISSYTRYKPVTVWGGTVRCALVYRPRGNLMCRLRLLTHPSHNHRPRQPPSEAAADVSLRPSVHRTRASCDWLRDGAIWWRKGRALFWTHGTSQIYLSCTYIFQIFQIHQIYHLPLSLNYHLQMM